MSVEEAIGRALSEVGLSPSHHDEIQRMLTDDDDMRPCCGGFCDPCVTTLRRAVQRARALIRA